MIRLAIKMLTGDRAKYIGIIVGVTFAALLITQQAAIFVGLMTRTFSFIDDTPTPNLWVMDPEVEHHADNKALLDIELQRVRSVEGVAWAVPMFKRFVQVRLPSGSLRGAILIGLDDPTLVGAPLHMEQGSLESLRQTDGIIVDAADLADKLKVKSRVTGQSRALKVGDVLELNDHRAQVVGVFRNSPSFFWEPVIYTTYTRALSYAPPERRQMNYVLVGAKAGQDIGALQQRIAQHTGLLVQTPREFSIATAMYIIKQTGIAINFGIAVLLGFIVGAAIAGQTFHNFTLDNLRHFGALKAMGAGNGVLMRMVIVQALTVGAIGFGLGVGAASLFGAMIPQESLAFNLRWELLAITGVAVLSICVLAAVISVRRVVKLEPAVVFKG